MNLFIFFNSGRYIVGPNDPIAIEAATAADAKQILREKKGDFARRFLKREPTENALCTRESPEKDAFLVENGRIFKYAFGDKGRGSGWRWEWKDSLLLLS